MNKPTSNRQRTKGSASDIEPTRRYFQKLQIWARQVNLHCTMFLAGHRWVKR